MPKASPLIPSLNAGEFSPRLAARVDFDKYNKGLQLCQNLVPLVQGPVQKRSGSYFVTHSKDDGVVRTLPFQFSTDQAYVLEFGHEYVRFFSDEAIVVNLTRNIGSATQTNPVVISSTAHGFSNGDRVFIQGVRGQTQINNREFEVANVTSDTFELAGEDGTGHDVFDGLGTPGTASRIVEIVSPYEAADLAQLKIAQSADVLYIAHPDYPPHKLSRTGATTFSLTAIDFTNGPFAPANINKSLTVYASAVSGTGVSLVASGALFTAAMIGSLFRLDQIGNPGEAWESDLGPIYMGDLRRYQGNYYEAQNTAATTGTVPPVHTEGEADDGNANITWLYLHSGFGWVEITAVTDAMNATATVIRRLPEAVVGSANGTYKWAVGAWSDDRGYPAAVTFFGDRLVWGGSPSQPQTLWGSRVGDYENHEPGVQDDSALVFTLNANDVNAIRWIEGDEKGLLVGTVGGEWVVRPSSINEALAPTNIAAAKSTGYGSNFVPPVRVGKAMLYVQRSGRKLRELAYLFEDDGFRSPNMTIRADHISRTGFIDAAFQAEPIEVIWLPRADGVLTGFTYERDQDVLAWHRHILGGVSDAEGTPAKVESVCAIPSTDGSRDVLWMVVQRYVGGQVVRHIEYLKPLFDDDQDQADGYFVDGGLTYEGASTEEIAGLNHLEGETVAILADGAIHTPRQVVGGVVPLERAATTVHIGYPFIAALKTERIEAGAADGTSQGKVKRIVEMVFHFLRTGNVSFGPDADTLDEMELRDTDDLMDTASPLISGFKRELWNAGYERDGCVYLESNTPTALTLLSLTFNLETQSPR